MNGLELARGYYLEYGRPMLEKEFGDLLPFIAVAFTGSGSEHYGFDDSISRDHDFEPGFSIFLPGEDLVDRRGAFLLERAYAKLPAEYMGVKRLKISPVGGSRHGVFRTAEYYMSAAGTADGRLSADDWLRIPDSALAEAVNGEVFYDGYGEVTAIRARLSEMPRDIVAKRVAGSLLIMAQAGQYNFRRCLSHGEKEAAGLAAAEFVTHSMKALFLLSGRYMPFYKWSFRAMAQIPGLEEARAALSDVLLYGASLPERTEDAIEKLSSLTADMLCAGNYSSETGNDLEKQAYAVNSGIKDNKIRNMHILASV